MNLRIPFALVLMTPLLAQAPAAPAAAPAVEPTPGHAVDATYAWVEGQFVPAAEAMPEDKFNFAPTGGEFKGVKTFAQQVKHIAAVNFFLGGKILGEKPPAEIGNPEIGPDSLKTKAEIVKYLKESFSYARKAVASITAKNGTTSMPAPFGGGTTTPLGLATLLAFHGMDHYGQMVVYLRMNGIVPPASRKQGS
jgi:uncharacterized damage-inducible protein DinB